MINTYVTTAARCAPSENKPLKIELDNCSTYLQDEIDILDNIKVIICLGRIAFESCCKLLSVKDKQFTHGKIFNHKKFTIICLYHPSRQNTQTGRLKWYQWQRHIFQGKKDLS